MSAPNALFSETILLLGGAVVAAPIFKKLGLGTVLGYLAAGIVIGPIFHGITDGEQILDVAELGVVFLLFIIGLELKPSRLWQMRRDIFGLGTAQVVLTGLALTALAWFSQVLDWRGSIVAGFGLALSSTAFAMQILEGDGDVNTKYGQRSFSMLLFQDLAIVPLLALITVLDGGKGSNAPFTDFAVAVGAVAAMIVMGRYLLTPLFQIIARTGAREAMIAAALFVVMGSASLMQLAGLSMAMGAFLSGVMLAESSYRHELEADIEPFRGVLLAIFFIAVGLSLELDVLVDNALFIIIAVPIVMAVKAIIIYGLCRISGSPHNDAIRIAFLLPPRRNSPNMCFLMGHCRRFASPSPTNPTKGSTTKPVRMAARPAGSAPRPCCRRRRMSPALLYPLRLRLNCRSGPRPSTASFSRPIPGLALLLQIRSLPELRVAAGAVTRLSTPANLLSCSRPWIRIHSHVDYYCCRTGGGRCTRRFALSRHLALAFLCRASRHTLHAKLGHYRIALSLQG
ncbi:monovalent cation:proton antiporter-2 (CPA2) family protein [Rhizobium pisi]|uniref:Monovalent cation:proton antiporter-2 (CPA2) family protein n=1 Tax=Rhizobium pisi TaxID=574561 RepID=A0A7W5BKN9_9HYPH|nr:monovalent cation:proton antiporter-2 (CPA2) family protein [Rhizobium pisi]